MPGITCLSTGEYLLISELLLSISGEALLREIKEENTSKALHEGKLQKKKKINKNFMK